MPNYEYELQGREIYDKNVGELCLPHFFAVIAAQKNDCSLRFHAKIGEHFHQYRINAVNEKSVNLVCAHKNCKAQQLLSASSLLLGIQVFHFPNFLQF